MNSGTDSKKALPDIRQNLLQIVIVLFLLIGTALLIFTHTYGIYTNNILYSERLNQMQEVTEQLFNGLEDVVENQWYNAEIQKRRICIEPPATMEQFLDFLDKQADLSKFEQMGTELIAVDSRGHYYTQDGAQGLLPEIELLDDEPEQINFVSSSATKELTQMFFLYRLDEPLQIQDASGTTKIIYYGIARDMTELNQYFRCDAYSGKNAIYVLDEHGTKLFSGENGNTLLEGFNAYTILQNMEYLHGSTFEATLDTLKQAGMAYSNAVLNGEECYYALYQMKNAAWVLLFFVPSRYVAVNTVTLMNSSSKTILIFAVAMLVVSSASIFVIMQMQQRHERMAEMQSRQALERVNSDLEQSNKELARTQNAATEALHAAETANKAKTDFLANMSHDIRTPMNAIVGLTNLMENELDDKERLLDHLEKLRASSQHLLNLINDILDMNKIESGAKTLNITEVNLAAQVAQLESVFRQQTADRNQTFTIQTTHLEHENVMCDEVSLNRVLNNIISNSIKYTPEGGHILLEIEEIPREGHYARYKFVVQDDGIGMSSEYLKHIYEPFTREESSLTNKVQGTGLGMAITRSIISQMGGSIHVESEQGKGSRFEIMLDFKINEEADKNTTKLRILLIQCSEATSVRIRDAAKNKPIELEFAAQFQDALELLRKNEYDVVLLSLKDPELKERVAQMRQVASAGTMILGAAAAQRTEVANLLPEVGVDGFIPLPFFLSNLEAELDHVKEAQKNAAVEQNVSPLKGMRFLCAEDNEINSEVLTAILEMSGASCKIYPNGAEIVKAFETVQPGDYDMILMDVQMPIMDGLDATRAIRSGKNPLGRTIPILAMTANAFTEDMEKSKEAGMDEHLSKPVDIAALEQAVRKYIVTPPENK